MVVKTFASIGVIVTSFIVGIVLFVLIKEFIDIVANNRKYKKKLKSRFEGGLTAKCFCKDCKYYHEKINNNNHGPNVGECAAHNNWWSVRDNWYCWNATPVEYDEAKRREKLGH